MKLRLFVLLASALFWAGNAHAEPSAAPPAAVPAAQPPVPTPPPAPAAQNPAPTARKEEESPSLTILQRVAAFANSRQRVAENTANLQAQIDTLRQDIADRDAVIGRQLAIITDQAEMLQQIGNWLVENGHSDPASIAANPAAAFADAVGQGVATAVRTIGVPVATIPTAPAPAAGGDGTLDEILEKIAACKDPKELGRLAALAQKLRSAN